MGETIQDFRLKDDAFNGIDETEATHLIDWRPEAGGKSSYTNQLPFLARPQPQQSYTL